jgi:hypothetical protein
MFRRNGHAGGVSEIAARVRDRLFDLSVFMKELKQRMTIAYNHSSGRKGTLWEGRFKCTLVHYGEALRCRVRYFTDGVVLGSQAFLDEFFESRRSNFGEARKSGARRMKGAGWGALRVLRDLRVDAVSPSGA